MIKPKEYAQALIEALEEASSEQKDRVLKHFITVVQRTSGMHEIKKIVKAVEEETVKRNGGKMVQVESARQLNEQQIRVIQECFEDKDRIINIVKPELIAGVRITINGNASIDNSMKRKLEKLLQ
ncbi:MAG: hypothetical protein COU08_04105 [Candidatus Harrisonbacteria bacterium CG10_big_fil_rev_8_21_14_0_10_42_17]|uniref:Uncharacterized protein n=1 Tax=Candidatus Harrisonbacteria bacterium CG10_big_fil_rev_8_21_14_0_10_42_17 TaxID=1974584 RepID=A0A2M6WGT8_9BACT|nr:MAG: hypothetical protein COU08_04105 [Candidatus Harrisonbacteria bacterium CG10_big_fil_rev_8_21_14_0_10_42_17]